MQVRVASNESGTHVLLDPEHVVEHQHLTITVGSGTDSNRGNVNRTRDHRRNLIRHPFKNDCEAARVGQGLGRCHQAKRRHSVSALDPETTHCIHRLGGEADMSHHGNLSCDQCLDHRQPSPTTFQLHRPGSGTYEGGRIGESVPGRDVKAHPGHVSDHQRQWPGSCDRCRVVRYVVHGHLERVLISEDDHCHRVADQDQVGTGFVDHPCTWRVIGGDHHEGFRAVGDLTLTNSGNRQPLSHGQPPCRPAPFGCRQCGKANSVSCLRLAPAH